MSFTDLDPRNHGSNKSAKDGGAKRQARTRDALPRLGRLFVCPCCFKYSKELVSWLAHVRICVAKEYVPGEKIYVHPKGTSRVPIASPQAPTSSNKRGGQAQRGMEETREVANEGEYTVWEVDGDKHTLFCQSLCLFAKLFLETKSVFYDVTGFKYYLVVYTAPPHANADIKHRIVGFFSKEKVSWDNNNLACILIFPPWQKMGLGELLMGVSYEISRREGMIGGPEKPISVLGMKGYKRFWGGEIVRWMETLEPNGDGPETVFSMEDISKATWIAPEDCMTVLRDMGATDAGTGPLKAKKRTRLAGKEPAGGGAEGGGSRAAGVEESDEQEELQDVRRVALDKKQVRIWALQNKISLARPCDPEGFVDGYIKRSVEVDGREDDYDDGHDDGNEDGHEGDHEDNHEDNHHEDNHHEDNHHEDNHHEDDNHEDSHEHEGKEKQESI